MKTFPAKFSFIVLYLFRIFGFRSQDSQIQELESDSWKLLWNYISKVGVGSILGYFAFCRLGWAHSRLCWVSLHSTQPTFCRCYCEMRNPTTANFGTVTQKFLFRLNWPFFWPAAPLIWNFVWNSAWPGQWTDWTSNIERPTSNIEYWWRYALSILKQANLRSLNRSLRWALRSWAQGQRLRVERLTTEGLVAGCCPVFCGWLVLKSIKRSVINIRRSMLDVRRSIVFRSRLQRDSLFRPV